MNYISKLANEAMEYFWPSKEALKPNGQLSILDQNVFKLMTSFLNNEDISRLKRSSISLNTRINSQLPTIDYAPLTHFPQQTDQFAKSDIFFTIGKYISDKSYLPLAFRQGRAAGQLLQIINTLLKRKDYRALGHLFMGINERLQNNWDTPFGAVFRIFVAKYLYTSFADWIKKIQEEEEEGRGYLVDVALIFIKIELTLLEKADPKTWNSPQSISLVKEIRRQGQLAIQPLKNKQVKEFTKEDNQNLNVIIQNILSIASSTK